MVNYKPVIKWAGGKSKVVNQLSKYIPERFNNYHEPFLGGGALFFYLYSMIKSNKKEAFLSDSVDELVNLYKIIRDDVDNLISISGKHVYDEQYYYEVRAQDTSKLNNLQRASRFLYLNKTCFNGLYRVNRKGQFNVSFGSYDNPVIIDENALLNASIAFKLAELSTGDFSLVLDKAQKHDFVYLDPPYVPLSATSNFTGYTPGSFSAADHNRLREAFEELSLRGCYVMLSNSNTDYVRDLYYNCNIKTINVMRAINSDVTKRGAIKELLILSYQDSEIISSNQALK